MTSFHIRHNFTPGLAREALLLLHTAPLQSVHDLVEGARSRDLELGRRGTADKVVASLRDLGLVEQSSERRGELRLSELGRSVIGHTARDRLLFVEYVHLRYWWLWSFQPDRALYSWAYRLVTTHLWENAPVDIDTDQIVATLLAAAEHTFNADSVSFSSASVLGIMHWIRALSPPVVTHRRMQRRFSCPPESLALAIEAASTTRGRDIDAPLPIDVQTRDLLCQSLLLDPVAMPEMLELAEESLGLIRRQVQGHEVVWLRESVLPGLVRHGELGCPN